MSHTDKEYSGGFVLDELIDTVRRCVQRIPPDDDREYDLPALRILMDNLMYGKSNR